MPALQLPWSRWRFTTAAFIMLSVLSTGVASCGGSNTSGASGGASGATGGRSGGSGGAGGGGGASNGTGGGLALDAGLPDGFSVDAINFDGIDLDAVAADLGITSCALGVTSGAACNVGVDQACRPTSAGNICVCQGGTWTCF